MPRIKTSIEKRSPPIDKDLVNRLADELQSGRLSGQPVIYEEAYRTGKQRVTVVWDRWDRLPLEQRTDIVLGAYELAEPNATQESIALASGLTVPEAYAAGMLPVRIIPTVRTGDPVTVEECYQAMIEEGASRLMDPSRPLLRFATNEEAEAARQRLSKRLPNSDPVWTITQDVGAINDWFLR